MKRICLIFILFSAAGLLFAQSVWTGNAAVSTEKEFESYYSEDGSLGKYLGASNSFPGSTEVIVTNPRNGKSVSVSIVKRLSQPGLFLVLSPEAGDAINLPDDDILNVEVVVRRKNDEVFNNYTDDLPYSEDPDLNPSAELAIDSPSEDVDYRSGTPATEEPEIVAPVATSVNEYIPPVVLNEEGTLYEEGYDPLVLMESSEEEDSEPEEIFEIIDDPLVLAEAITSSGSELDIPLPERYDESDLPDSYAAAGIPEEKPFGKENAAETVLIPSDPGVLKPEELGTDFLEADIDDLLITGVMAVEPENTETAAPEISEIIRESEGVDEMGLGDLFLAEPVFDQPIVDALIEDIEPIVIIPELETELKTQIESEEEEALVEGSVLENPENVIYFLTPGDFRPPPLSEDKRDKEKEKVKEKTIVPLPVERSELEDMIVTELRNGGFYIQLGTYSSVDILYSQIEQISDSYPSIVLTVGNREEQIYKLLIGPISRDEKGVVLTRFRGLGYGDAFLYTPSRNR